MSQKLQRLFFLSLLLAAFTASAQSGPWFPGQTPDKRLMKAQQKSDELFETHHYERAMMIYRNDLAPVGDKYAQYMVGYMHLAGKGVPEDQVLASAWYRLAAERGHKTFARARDVLLQALNDEQRSRSDQIYAGLRDELGDIAIIAQLISADLAQLRGYSGPSRGISFNAVTTPTDDRSENRFRRLRRQTEARMNYLLGLAESGNLINDQEREKIAELRVEVEQILGSKNLSK